MRRRKKKKQKLTWHIRFCVCARTVHVNAANKQQAQHKPTILYTHAFHTYTVHKQTFIVYYLSMSNILLNNIKCSIFTFPTSTQTIRMKTKNNKKKYHSNTNSHMCATAENCVYVHCLYICSYLHWYAFCIHTSKYEWHKSYIFYWLYVVLWYGNNMCSCFFDINTICACDNGEDEREKNWNRHWTICMKIGYISLHFVIHFCFWLCVNQCTHYKVMAAIDVAAGCLIITFLLDWPKCAW